MSMELEIQRMIDKFRRRMSKDPETRAKVEPITKTLNIDLGDEFYSMKIEHAEITEFRPELIDDPDVTLMTTCEYLQELIDGTLRPMKAYVTKKIRIKGKIEDIMHLKALF